MTTENGVIEKLDTLAMQIWIAFELIDKVKDNFIKAKVSIIPHFASHTVLGRDHVISSIRATTSWVTSALSILYLSTLSPALLLCLSLIAGFA